MAINTNATLEDPFTIISEDAIAQTTGGGTTVIPSCKAMCEIKPEETCTYYLYLSNGDQIAVTCLNYEKKGSVDLIIPSTGVSER